MKRIIPIIAICLGLTLSTAALAQDPPPDPAPVAAVDVGAASDAAPAPATVDVLPPPVAGEPTDVGSAIEDGSSAFKSFKSGDILAGLVLSLMIVVWLIRRGLSMFSVSLGKTWTYALVGFVALAQQFAVVAAGATSFSWTMLLTAIVAVLASGKLFDLGKAKAGA